MREVEKILEEIEKGSHTFELFGRDVDFVAIDWVRDIIRKHMNDDWIPVDDRDHMPDAGEHVLVSIGTGTNPEKASLSEDGRWMMLHAPDGYNDITDEVEAWMPMPKPYHSESDNKSWNRLGTRLEPAE